MARFIYIHAEDGTFLFINADQISFVDEIRDEHCRIVFDTSTVVSLNGKPADRLIENLARGCEVADGRAIEDVVPARTNKPTANLKLIKSESEAPE
jgi:hypothetical protein